MANEIDFKDCPIGVLNEQKIDHMAQLFEKDLNMAIQQLENKVDAINNKIDSNFEDLNKKVDKIDSKVHTLDKKLEGIDNLENYVDSRIENSQKDKAFALVKWVITTLIGGTVLTLLGSYLIKVLIK